MSLLGILVLIFFLYLRYVDMVDGRGNDSLSKMTGLLFCLVAGVGLNEGVKHVALSQYYDFSEEKRKAETKIYSISGIGQSVHGTFTLGFGSVNSQPVYYAYIRAKDGAWLLKQFSGSLPIYEDATADSAVFKLTHTYTKCAQNAPIPAWIYILWPVHCWGIASQEFGSLHVPLGTIRKEFKL
jgi:hypothetical protein